MELRETEVLKFNVMSNLFRGKEAVGGKLIVTSERIYFKPHVINIQTEELELELKEVKSIDKCNTLGLVPNGVVISSNDNKSYKFVLWNRNKIIDYINKAITT